MSITAETVFIGGEAYDAEDTILYQKTTDTYEQVAGLIGSQGTSAHQVKIYVANARPSFIFDRQTSYPGIVSGVENSNYATDGKPVNGRKWGCFKFVGLLNDGNTIVKGQGLQPEAATGKLDAWTTGYLCAIALEAKTASGADADIKCISVLFNGGSCERIVDEAIVVSVSSCVATVYPLRWVDYVESVHAATTTGGLKIITQGTVATGEVKINYSTGAMTFFAADGVTGIQIRYGTNGGS